MFPSLTKREIRHFHVVVVQRRLRNVQNKVMHVQSYCFANLNLFPFCRSRCRRRRRCLSSLIIFNIGYAPATSTWLILFHFLKVILRKSQVESQIIKKNKLVLLSMDKCAIKVCCQKGSRDLDRCILKTISGINLITRYQCFVF